MITDSIGNFLTRIRNAQVARHRILEAPASNMKKKITEILYKNGYILKYKFDDEAGPQGVIKIALKYHSDTKEPVIRKLRRVSRPGLRNYVNTDSIPRVNNGLGVAIISTSKGVLTDKEARRQKVGGEFICEVF